MINQEETFIIDREFAYVGPRGFDLGILIANLMMSLVSHCVKSQDSSYQEWLLETIKTLLTQFEKKFLKLWNNQAEETVFEISETLIENQNVFTSDLLCEAVGFAGCEIARRQLGIAGVEDIQGMAEEASIEAAKMALAIARHLVVEAELLSSPKKLIEVLKVLKANRSLVVDAQHAKSTNVNPRSFFQKLCSILLLCLISLNILLNRSLKLNTRPRKSLDYFRGLETTRVG